MNEKKNLEYFVLSMCLFLFYLSFSLGCNRSNQTIASTSNSTNTLTQETASPKIRSKDSLDLTDKEKEQLQKLVPQILKWLSIWEVDSDCSETEITSSKEVNNKFKKTNENFSNLYKRFENKKVRTQLNVQPDFVEVYVTDINAFLLFRRTEDGLIADRPKRICSIPDNISNYRSVAFLIPSISSKEERDKSPEGVKKNLLENILKEIQKNACYSLSYSPNSAIEVIVPDFEVGDPEIYILSKGKPKEILDGKSVDWLRLKNDQVKLIKNFGLPDEIKELSQIIEKRVLFKTNVVCDKDKLQ